MTTDIDRTIEKLKLVVEKMKVVGDSNYWTMKEHEQLAEWLEELKKLRQCTNIENREYPYFDGFKEGKQVGYNKAIDDLLEVANEMAIEVDAGTYTMKAIATGLLEQIAEQLKVGGADD